MKSLWRRTWLQVVGVGMAGGLAAGIFAGRATASDLKQCYYYPPNPPACDECSGQCMGSGYVCCQIIIIPGDST